MGQSQKQNVKQNVIITLAPPKRKRKRKKKQKKHNIGEFRTALARSAYIQRSLGGFGFNQAPNFRRDIDQNAVRLNARSQFEGTRRQRPTLNVGTQTKNISTPVATAGGSVRGNSYTPRQLFSNSPIPSSIQSEIEAVQNYYDVVQEEEPIARRLRPHRKESPYHFG